jgi:DNA (cytosine-5)-methyltransferase 1
MNELHLFAGAGGGILGGILLGHTCVCAVEIKEYRRRALLQRQRDGIFPRFPIWDDVQTFDGNPWHGRVDIVAGGFPCQNISPAGDRTGIKGIKSGLWREMARIIREVRPTYAFVENAAMLTVRGLGTVLGDLAEMGFNAKWGVLGAADAIWLDGTPVFDHERLRCFIKASHPDRIGQLQPQGCVSDERGRPSNGIATPAHANSFGQQSAIAAQTVEIYSQGNTSPFERARNRISVPIAAANNGWWTNEPGVGRMVHGLANRDDRIAAIGDGQVPAVVKLAWETLSAICP